MLTFFIILLPLIIIAFLQKFKIIDLSKVKKLISIKGIKNGFKKDIINIKNANYVTIMKNRWHLHALIGLGTTFSMLIFLLDMPFWQQLILIAFTSFMIQVIRELYLVNKGTPADFSDPRFGMYGSLLGLFLYGILSLFIIFKIWLLILLSSLIYIYVYHLVFNKNQ